MEMFSKVGVYIAVTSPKPLRLKHSCVNHFIFPADVVLNKAKKRCKGFGYVTFAEEEEARKAQIGMNGKVRIYKPKVSKL